MESINNNTNAPELNEYDAQAEKFLNDTGTTYQAEFREFAKKFNDDKHPRLIFTCTLTRGSRSYSCEYGASYKDTEDFFKRFIRNDRKQSFRYPPKTIADEQDLKKMTIRGNFEFAKFVDFTKVTPPRAYELLACLTSFDPGSFEGFCASYGYDEDSRKAEKVYQAVKAEFQSLQALYNDKELSQLGEIR